MEYRILIDEFIEGQKSATGYVTSEGALILWSAYKKQNPHTSQTMERREQRGGICWLSEIKQWKEKGLLPEDFDLTNYMTRTEPSK